MKTLKIPYALNDGKLVHVSEVENGFQPDCLCPSCKQPLIARKGNLKVHHFAHSTDHNCQSETVVHILGKQIIAEKIQSALSRNSSLSASWNCKECYDVHEYDLTKEANRVAIENNLGILQPDIALFGRSNEPVAVIEVVVTHPPEENVYNYCIQHDIPLFEIMLKKMGDLEALRDNANLCITKVNLCLRPKCKECGHALGHRKLYIVDGTCWKCGSSMPIAFVDCDGFTVTPECMTADEIALANNKGAYIKSNYSRTLGCSEQSNTCPRCNSLTGNFYVHEFIELSEGLEGIPTGMSCNQCGE